LVVLTIYQAWHFGAQNIGVASFISLSDRGRSLHRHEKTLIRCGIVAGMLGVLQAMMPVAAGWLGPLGYIGLEVPRFGYEIGAAASIPITGVAIWMMIQGFRAGHYRFGVAIALSACFLFPMYLTHNYVLGFVSFALAHGVQYLIFLFTHSVGERQPMTDGRARLGMPVLLIALVIAGVCIWNIPRDRKYPEDRCCDCTGPYVGALLDRFVPVAHEGPGPSRLDQGPVWHSHPTSAEVPFTVAADGRQVGLV
jgi:hypothetical protein